MIYKLTQLGFNDNFFTKVNNSEFDLKEREKEYINNITIDCLNRIESEV